MYQIMVKIKIFSFDIDSAIADPAYLPIEKMKMGEDVFPDRYVYINDTLSIAITIHRLSSHDFFTGDRKIKHAVQRNNPYALYD